MPKIMDSVLIKEIVKNLSISIKNSIQKHYDWKQFDFNFSPIDQYEDISDFIMR